MKMTMKKENSVKSTKFIMDTLKGGRTCSTKWELRFRWPRV